MTIEDFSDLRTVRGATGKITSVIDEHGVDMGLVSSAVDPVTGGIIGLTAGSTTRYFNRVTQAGVPVGLPPSGTVGSNGALTLGSKTAQTLTVSATTGTVTLTAGGAAFVGTTAGDVGRVITLDGGKQITITVATSTTVCTGTISGTLSTTSFASNTWWLAWPFSNTYSEIYLYLPADAIFSGSPAGFYFSQMASTTVGTVKQDRYLAGANEIPIIPTSPVSFSGTTGADYITPINVANGIPALNVTIPGGFLGKNGCVLSWTMISRSKGAGNDTHYENFNGQQAYIAGLSGASTTSILTHVKVQNRGSLTKQITTPNQVSTPITSGTQPYRIMTHDTSADIPYVVSFAVDTASNHIVCESMYVEVSPSE